MEAAKVTYLRTPGSFLGRLLWRGTHQAGGTPGRQIRQEKQGLCLTISNPSHGLLMYFAILLYCN